MSLCLPPLPAAAAENPAGRLQLQVQQQQGMAPGFALTEAGQLVVSGTAIGGSAAASTTTTTAGGRAPNMVPQSSPPSSPSRRASPPPPPPRPPRPPPLSAPVTSGVPGGLGAPVTSGAPGLGAAGSSRQRHRRRLSPPPGQGAAVLSGAGAPSPAEGGNPWAGRPLTPASPVAACGAGAAAAAAAELGRQVEQQQQQQQRGTPELSLLQSSVVGFGGQAPTASAPSQGQPGQLPAQASQQEVRSAAGWAAGRAEPCVCNSVWQQ